MNRAERRRQARKGNPDSGLVDRLNYKLALWIIAPLAVAGVLTSYAKKDMSIYDYQEHMHAVSPVASQNETTLENMVFKGNEFLLYSSPISVDNDPAIMGYFIANMPKSLNDGVLNPYEIAKKFNASYQLTMVPLPNNPHFRELTNKLNLEIAGLEKFLADNGVVMPLASNHKVVLVTSESSVIENSNNMQFTPIYFGDSVRKTILYSGIDRYGKNSEFSVDLGAA